MDFKAIATARVGKDIGLTSKTDFEIFIPDTTPPTIVSKSPDNDAHNIDIATPIKIEFSENMLADTIKGTNIKLLNEANTDVEGTTVSLYAATQKTVTITHPPLDNGKKYTVKVTTGVKDSAGNAIASEIDWLFSTKTS
jgi:methionine-rich copper-binding protein CopC